VLGLEGYGIAAGCKADFVVLQAADEIDALRLRPARLWVVRRGRVIARTPKVASIVELSRGEEAVDFT
jgi:cytosine deaminase